MWPNFKVSEKNWLLGKDDKHGPLTCDAGNNGHFALGNLIWKRITETAIIHWNGIPVPWLPRVCQRGHWRRATQKSLFWPPSSFWKRRGPSREEERGAMSRTLRLDASSVRPPVPAYSTILKLNWKDKEGGRRVTFAAGCVIRHCESATGLLDSDVNSIVC